MDKPQPEKKQAGEPKDEAAGKDAGKDANKESAPVGAKGKDVKPEMPGKSAQAPAETEDEKAKDGASADKAKSDPAKQAPITRGNLKSGKGIKPKPLKDVDPGIDKDEPFIAENSPLEATLSLTKCPKPCRVNCFFYQNLEKKFPTISSIGQRNVTAVAVVLQT